MSKMNEKRCAFYLTLFIGCWATIFFAATAFAVSDDVRVQNDKGYHPTRILAQADDLKAATTIAAENNLTILKTFAALSEGMGHWYGVFEMKPGSRNTIESVVSALKTQTRAPKSGLRLADYDHYLYVTATPNDPKFNDLWAFHNIGQKNYTPDADIDAPEAWNIETGSSDQVIAIVDTGISYKHPDLAPNIWKNKREVPGNGVDDDNNGYVDDVYGINTVSGNGDPQDDHDHGSHVAGIAGAAGNNNEGVVGVNWNVKLMGLKFLNGAGSGPESKAMECMNYIIDQMNKGVNIVAVNHSYGGPDYHQGLNDAIDLAGKKGAISFIAAGNEGTDIDKTPEYPASANLEYAIVVGNSNFHDKRSSDSCWGSKSVDLFAPGYMILSCNKGMGYREWGGTSMASPMVAGACALGAARFPKDTVKQRMGRILKSVDLKPAFSGICVTGGRLNLYKVVEGNGDFVNAMFSYESHLDNNTATFKDISTTSASSITSWTWDFGDGSTSTQKNPVHTYNTEGTYTVTLTIRDSNNMTDKGTQQVAVPRPLRYCGSSSFSAHAYIKRFSIGSFSHPSGGEQYSLYDKEIISLNAGQTYTMSVEATDGPFGGDGYIRVWFDFNRNEDFSDPGELVFERKGSGPMTTSVTIPSNVVNGKKVGVRVSMDDSQFPPECGPLGWGEVEDYRARF